MFPMMGLFLVFIPLGGFLLALLLCFIRRLRFLAPFVFLMPLLTAYSAMAGFWGVGIGLERVGFNRWVVALSCWLGLSAGAALGGLMGFVIAFGLRRLARRFMATQ